MSFVVELAVKFKAAMDSSEIISAISAVIACIATLISYRIYRNSAAVRKNDRVLGLRVRALELRSRLSAFLSKNREVIDFSPDSERDLILAETADRVLEKLETLSSGIKSRSSDLTEAELDETELMLRECEGEMVPLEHKLDRLLEKI
jgi:hypothetical protein